MISLVFFLPKHIPPFLTREGKLGSPPLIERGRDPGWPQFAGLECNLRVGRSPYALAACQALDQLSVRTRKPVAIGQANAMGAGYRRFLEQVRKVWPLIHGVPSQRALAPVTTVDSWAGRSLAVRCGC